MTQMEPEFATKIVRNAFGSVGNSGPFRKWSPGLKKRKGESRAAHLTLSRRCTPAIIQPSGAVQSQNHGVKLRAGESGVMMTRNALFKHTSKLFNLAVSRIVSDQSQQTERVRRAI